MLMGLRPYPSRDRCAAASPEAGNWLQYRGNYAGWGYSPLDQITQSNVGRLTPTWIVFHRQAEGHQAPPIVNNGVMFVSHAAATR